MVRTVQKPRCHRRTARHRDYQDSDQPQAAPLFAASPWERTHGGAIAALGHLTGDLRRLVISASYPYSMPTPWGSSWRIDEMFASEGLHVCHVGAGLFRRQNLRLQERFRAGEIDEFSFGLEKRRGNGCSTRRLTNFELRPLGAATGTGTTRSTHARRLATRELESPR